MMRRKRGDALIAIVLKLYMWRLTTIPCEVEAQSIHIVKPFGVNKTELMRDMMVGPGGLVSRN